MNLTQWIILNATQERTKQREKLPEKERKIAEQKEAVGGAYSCFISGVIFLLFNIWMSFNIKNREKFLKNLTFWQALPKIPFTILSILSVLFFLGGWWLLSCAWKLQEEIKDMENK